MIGVGILALLAYIALLLRKRRQNNPDPDQPPQASELGHGLPHELPVGDKRHVAVSELGNGKGDNRGAAELQG